MFKKSISIILISTVFISIFTSFSTSVQAVTQAEINANLASINTELTNAQKNLTDISSEKNNLQDQLNLLQNQIQENKNLTSQSENILANVETQIQQNQQEIVSLNTQLRLIIREIQIQNKTSPLEYIVSSQNFSDAMGKMMNYINLQDNAISLKSKKETREEELKVSKQQQQQVKENLQQLATILSGNQDNVKYLLEQTNGSQQKYEELLAQKKADLEKWQNTVAVAPKPKPQPIRPTPNPNPSPNPNPTPNPTGDFIYPSDMTTTRTSRCASGHGYPACDFPSYSNPTPPVFASKSGTITRASTSCANYSIGCNSGYGNFIRINHGDGTETLYAHLFGIFVSQGQSVSQGQQIGQIGCSGSSFGMYNPSLGCWGTHLHFEIRINGRGVNPADYIPMPRCESGNCR